MAQWTNININKSNVVVENGKSILIAMPLSSRYGGYSFWHLKKLVREGRNKGAISIGFTNDFVFRLKKYGKGRYNKTDVLDEVTVDANVILKEFEEIDSNIVARKER